MTRARVVRMTSPGVDLDGEQLDLTDPRWYGAGFPHELFGRLRRAGAVHRHPPVTVAGHHGAVEFWSVVAHAEIERANRDWETFSAFDGTGLAPSDPELRGHMIVSMDPPDHTRVRRLISSGFTPRMIAALDAHIAERTGRILDDVAARGEIDFVRDVAYLLPMHVIADIVGIPEDERPWVFERTDVLLRSLAPGTPLSEADRLRAQADVFAYAQQLSAARRANPRDDVWSQLALAELAGDDGGSTSLSELELDMFFVVLTLAGSETTRNALSQGLLALVDHPDQVAALRADPGLIGSATDEIIRWASPVLFFGRTATRDVELGGAAIRAGDRVVLWYPSGNRDERAFPDPFRFDVRRKPNPHVSFGGGGPHYCLGANLAKKEVQVMIGALLERFGTIEVTGAPEWAGTGPAHNVGVSIDRLPVRVVAR